MSKQKKAPPQCGLCGQVNPVSNHKKVCPARFDKITPRDQDVSLREIIKSQKAIKDAQASKVTEVWVENTSVQSEKVKNLTVKPLALILSKASKTELADALESALENPAERAAIEAYYNTKIAWAA